MQYSSNCIDYTKEQSHQTLNTKQKTNEVSKHAWSTACELKDNATAVISL